MKKKVSYLIIAFMTCLLVYAQVQTLNINQFESKLKEAGANAQLVDVRTADEFNKDHLKSALNYDIFESSFESNINKLDKNKPVFVYCYSGGRSSQACGILKKKGFKVVYDMTEGFSKWKSSGKNVVK